MIHSNIQEIIRKYKDLHDNLTERIMQAESVVMLDQLDKGFKDQRSPYGPSWPPKKDGTIFDPSHDLQNSFVSDYTRDTATIKSEYTSAVYHQYGTDNLPERKMIPEEGRGFGFWKDPMLRAAQKVVRDTMQNNYAPLTSNRSKLAQKAAKVAEKAIQTATKKQNREISKAAKAYGKKLGKKDKDKRTDQEKIKHINDLIGELL